jgi:toxin ParE1/3/4
MKVILSPTALIDLQEIWSFIADHSQERADQFVDFLVEKCNALGASPYMGRSRDKLEPGLRSYPVRAYLIFYRITQDRKVEIARIVHGSRNLERLFE